MRGGIEGRSKRIAAWDLAAATTALMALGVMAISSVLYALLPVILLSAMIRPRLPGRGMPEILLSAAALGGGFVFAGNAGLRNATGILAPVAAEVLLGALLLMIVRLYLHKPWGGPFLTLGIGLAGVTAAGSANLDWAYPALATLFLIVGLHGLLAREHARTQPRFPPLRALIPGSAFLLASAGFALALSLALPHVYGFATERFVDWVRPDSPKIGFTEGAMFLGSMEGMWESDEVVMRIQGDVFNAHLRGSVHRTYRRGGWLAEKALTPAPVDELQNSTDANSPVRVQRLSEANSPLLMPLNAELVSSADFLQRDAFGLVRAVSNRPPARYAYQIRELPAQVLAPAPADLQVPAELQEPLRKLATDWVLGAATPDEKLQRLVQRLEGDFVYSQHYQRIPGRDPVLDFLQDNRQGHCEYFASALALLARALQIPARVVRGYRVRERNPLTGAYLVRESNAHAWVEAYADDHWQALDPAPLQSAEPPPDHSMSWLGSLVDAIDFYFARLRVTLENATRMYWQWLVIAVLIGGSWIGLRRIRRRLQANQPAQAPAVEAASEPLAEFDQLMNALRTHGFARQPGETLESFTHRLPGNLPDALRAQLQNLFREYAAYRYGGHGMATSLVAEMQKLANEVESRSNIVNA